jgi:drug/metabolite transporter (DMT)-like permease
MLPVLLSAALHAGWNAWVKSGTERYLDTLSIVVGSAAVAACCIVFLPSPARASWPCIVGSSLIHVGYFTLVALAYQHGDMSLVYPLTRGSAPALTALASAAILHEAPSMGGWAGILLVSGGVLLLAADSHRAGNVRAVPVVLALSNAAVVVTYTLVDGTGARLSAHPFSYTSWMTLLTAAMFAPIAVSVRGREAIRHVAAGWPKAAAGGACTLGSYSLALWAMTLAPLALVSAIRETSIVFGTVIAVALLGERVSRLRYTSIAIVTAGAITIKLL